MAEHTVHVVHQQFGDSRQAEAVAAIRRAHASAFRHLLLRIVIVDNKVDAPTQRALGDGVTLIDGDNSFREFTAWDKGWQWTMAHAAPSDDDVVIISNETFTADPEVGDFHALPADADALLAQGRVLGHVDGLAEAVRVFGTRMRTWIKSNFVVMTARAMRAISPLTLRVRDDELFVDDPRMFFRDRDDLSANYREFIKGFLQGKPNVALWRWHSAKPFDADNLVFFRLKARAILCEHALSARAVSSGFILHDLSKPRFPSKDMRHRLRRALYRTQAWRLVPRFRQRFI